MKAKKLSKSILAVMSAVVLALIVMANVDVLTIHAATKDPLTTIDFTESYELTAGMGSNQSLNVTSLKDVNFKVTKNQKVTLTLDFLKDYSGSTKNKSITLNFIDSKGNTVSQVVKSSDTTTEFVFNTAGVYELSIENAMNTGLWYRFTLSELKK